MRKLANLNIGNTFRSANMNIITKQDYYPVNKEFKYSIDDIKKHKIPNDNYMIKYSWYADDTINYSLIDEDYLVRYETDYVIPFPVLLLLGKSNHSYPVYQLKKHYDRKEVENVRMAMLAAEDQTVVSVTVDVVNDSPWDLLFDISALRYLVKSLEINFKEISKAEYASLGIKDKRLFEEYEGKYIPTTEAKANYYRITYEPLARWRIKDYLVVPDEDHRVSLLNACDEVLVNG